MKIAALLQRHDDPLPVRIAAQRSDVTVRLEELRTEVRSVDAEAKESLTRSGLLKAELEQIRATSSTTPCSGGASTSIDVPASRSWRRTT